jgi:hypothetical protein
MKRLLFAILPLLLLVACRRPEVEAFAKRPAPIVVSFEIPPGYSRNEAVKGDYAAALRARLATCVMVVPDGEPAPDPSAELHVSITQIRSHSEPSPAMIGTATGVAVGTLSALAGNRDAFFDGLFWGLWTGSAAADARDWNGYRLGYEPVRVSAVVKLQQTGSKDPLMEFSVRASEVIAQMAPLSPSDRNDGDRIREEEAKAFAKVVVSRLQEQFHWLPLAEPSYYQPPVPVPAQPAP